MSQISSANKALLIWSAALCIFVLAYSVWMLAFRTEADYFVIAAIEIGAVMLFLLVLYGSIAKSVLRATRRVRYLNRLAAIWWSFVGAAVLAMSFLPCPSCDELAGQRYAMSVFFFGFVAAVHWVFHRIMAQRP
ncbi:hypothetical protein [Pseudooceanicola sp.]|uniref:hypothetical protein n=1 Tax=Pseudooceanicola sp. TaxID=1914328 RepID=UPI0035180A9A